LLLLKQVTKENHANTVGELSSCRNHSGTSGVNHIPYDCLVPLTEKFMNEDNDHITPNFFAVGNILQHYKGGLYTIVGTCLIEATLKPGVLYKPHQGDSQDIIWMRPMAEFQEQITTEKGAVQRFVLVSNGDSSL
jgi:hypothetical protein